MMPDYSVSVYHHWLRCTKPTKLGHRVDNAEKSLDRLGLLADHGLVDLELDVVVVKVVLELLAIDVEDVGVHHRQTAVEACELVGKAIVALFKDVLCEAEVVFDLLIALDVETVLGLLDLGGHVRHDGRLVESVVYMC